MEFKKLIFIKLIFIMTVFAIFYANFSVFATSPKNIDIQLTLQEREMFNLVNSERGDRGLQPYIIDLELVKLARIKAEDMVANGYFAHHSPNFGSPFEMMKSFGVTHNSAGENIAENRVISGAHDALMLSAGHRANILSERFDRIGIGIVEGPREFKTMVQMFIESND